MIAGAEVYGGLGDTWDLSLHDTSHYAAVLLGWQLPKSMRISFSPGFGITGSSLDQIYRMGFAYEVPEIGSWFRHGNGGVR